jgi:hypothetical protein
VRRSYELKLSKIPCFLFAIPLSNDMLRVAYSMENIVFPLAVDVHCEV